MLKKRCALHTRKLKTYFLHIIKIANVRAIEERSSNKEHDKYEIKEGRKKREANVK